jgi:hypothetical protein
MTHAGRLRARVQLEVDGRRAHVGGREARRRLLRNGDLYRESKNASSIFLSLSLDAS